MPFVPVPDCVQCKIEGRVDGQTTINDLYFRHTTGPISLSDMNALRVAVATWYQGFIVPNLNEAWTGVRLQLQGLTNSSGIVTEQSLLGVQGGVTGEAAPNNCSMAVSFRTGLAGRSNHGRNYVPVLTNSQLVGNNIDPDWATTIVDGYFELVFPGTALPGGWLWVVVSRRTNNDWRTTGVFQEITSVQVTDLTVDSMRTRLPGRGR